VVGTALGMNIGMRQGRVEQIRRDMQTLHAPAQENLIAQIVSLPS
jgi:hypothetical protein